MLIRRRLNRIVILAVLILFTAVFAMAQASRTGTFEGRSKHEAQGTVHVVMGEAGAELVLGDDFVFDGAPDPKLAFGRDGYDPKTLFSPLKKNRGEQTYRIPERINLADYDQVWIWCEKFDVPLAVAEIGTAE